MRSASSGAVWIGVQTLGVQVISLGVFSTIAHYVTPAAFGVIGVVYSIVFSCKTLFLDNIAAYLVRQRDPSDIDYSTIFWITTIFSGVITFALFLVGGYVGLSLTLGNAGPVIKSMSLMFFFLGLGRTHDAWMTRNFLFRALALCGMIGAILGGLVGIAMAVYGYGVFALVFQQIAGSIVTLCLMWWLTPWRPSFVFSSRVARSLASLLKTTTLTALLNAVAQNGDVLLITYYFGVNATGFYSVSKRLRSALQLVAAAPIIGVSLPSLAAIQDDHERLRRGLVKGLMLLSASCTPVFVGAATVAPELLVSAFGVVWRPASPIFSIMALAALPAIVLNFYDLVYLVFGRQRWSLLASTLIIGLSVLSFFAIHHDRLSLAAVPFALPYLVVFPLMTFLMMRLLRLSLISYVEAVAPCLISACVMFTVVKYVDARSETASNALRLCLLAFTGAAAYIGCMAVVGRSHLNLLIAVVRELFKRRVALGVAS